MPIEVVYEPNHCQLVLSIKRTGGEPEDMIDETVALLDEALEIIRSRLPDDGVWYFAIDIREVHESGTMFSAWGEGDTGDNAVAWGVIAERPRLHEAMKNWLAKVEQLVQEANGMGRAISSIWEGEDSQLGEVAASVLAFSDVGFVRSYARLLNVWDMDHEVMQSEWIDAIVRRHGKCPETEELLFVRAVEAQGQDQIQVLFPFLQQLYGDFPSSALFRRIIASLHARYRAEYFKWYNEIQERRIKHPDAQPFSQPPKPDYFSLCRDMPALQEGAARLTAELEAEAGPLPAI